MITAEQARELALDQISRGLDWFLEQIEIRARNGKTYINWPNEIRLTEENYSQLRLLGYRIQNYTGNIIIHWA